MQDIVKCCNSDKMSSYWLLGFLPFCSLTSSLVVPGQPTLVLPPAGFSAVSLTDLLHVESRPPIFVVGGVSQTFRTEGQTSFCNTNVSDSKTAKRACDLTQPSSVLDQNNVIYQCDQQLSNLEGNDCRDAWQDMPGLDRTQVSFGNRTASHYWDVPLPFRFISRESTSLQYFITRTTL